MAVADTAAEREREQQEQAEREVGPLLARANLLRMRGQWDEAIAACTDALRHAPRSATAHSLLGDIYEAQGRLDDAAQWFGMAVDLDPTNVNDREKLERATAAAAAAAQQAAAAVLSRPARSGPARTRERTQEWFDHLFPPGRSEGIARLILALSGLIALVLVAAAAFVALRYNNESHEAAVVKTGTSSIPSAATVTPQPQPPQSGGTTVRVVTPPPSAPSPQAGQAGALPPQQQPMPGSSANGSSSSPATGTGAPAPVAAGGASSDPDAARLAALARSLPPGIAATAVRVDPRTALVALDITVSAGARTDTAEAARERIIRAAAYEALISALSDARIQRIAVRVSRRVSGSTSPAASLAFVAEAMANGLRSADPVTGSSADLLLLFSNPWWSQELAPSAG